MDAVRSRACGATSPIPRCLRLDPLCPGQTRVSARKPFFLYTPITSHGVPPAQRPLREDAHDLRYRVVTNRWARGRSRAPLVPTCNTVAGNATDSAPIIDTMHIFPSASVDEFRIFSSDGEYARLAARACEKGLSVIGIGRSSTPKSLVDAERLPGFSRRGRKRSVSAGSGVRLAQLRSQAAVRPHPIAAGTLRDPPDEHQERTRDHSGQARRLGPRCPIRRI